MCEGEYESLKAIHAVSPDFVPRPYAWGEYQKEESKAYFLLEEFRSIGDQVSTVEKSGLASSSGLTLSSLRTQSNWQQDSQIFIIGPSHRLASLVSTSKHVMVESNRTWISGTILGPLSSADI
jgi:hypothetical protein